MSNRGAAVLAIRLLGLYLAVQALLALTQWLLEERTLNVLVAEVVLPLALAVCLWVAVGALANHILPARRGASMQTAPPLDADAAHTVVVAAVGLLVLADALPVFVTALWATGQSLPVGRMLLVEQGLRSLFGLVLLLGAQGAAGVMARLSGGRG